MTQDDRAKLIAEVAAQLVIAQWAIASAVTDARKIVQASEREAGQAEC